MPATPAASTSASERPQPRGREAVRTALIEAAARLFADRGPAAVSVRDIAREAGVNHGLVHRHFGAKEALVMAVMNHLSGAVDEALGPPNDTETLAELLPKTLSASARHGSHWRILAHSILRGDDPAGLQAGFPVVVRLVAAARRDGRTSISAEALVVMIVATGLGMMMFSPYLQAAAGLDDEAWEKTRAEVFRNSPRGLL